MKQPKNSHQKVTRVPVRSPDGKPLMPTTPARARKWIQSGKAVGKRNKVGVFYVQLLSEPSGYKTQVVVAGTDRGKAFTGLAFQTKLATIAIFHACLPGFHKSTSTYCQILSVPSDWKSGATLTKPAYGGLLKSAEADEGFCSHDFSLW